MQFIFIASLALVVGTNANILRHEFDLESKGRIGIGTEVKNKIQEFAESMRDNGWDPLEVDSNEGNVTVQTGITVTYKIINLNITNMSNIQVLKSTFSIFTNTLQLELSIPAVYATLLDSNVVVDYYGTEYTGVLSGDLTLKNINVVASIRLTSIISNIAIRSADVKLTGPQFKSQLIVHVQGEDQSDYVNNVIEVQVPELLNNNKDTINSFLSNLLKEWGNEQLG